MNKNRRAFMKSNVALGATAALSNIATIANAAPTEDYRALVCIFMFGGNDANNMIVPRDPADWTTYSGPRGGLAIPRDTLLSIKPTNVQGREFGFHPAMGGIQSLFNTGKAAVIANVGTLAQPLTKAQYQSGTGLRPTNLFSHSDQQTLWHTSAADNTIRTGWGGRVGDRVAGGNQSGNLTTCLSVAGNSSFLSGDTIRPFPVSPSGRFGLDFIDGGSDTAALSAGVTRMLGNARTNIMENVWLEILNGAIVNQKQLSAGLSGSPAFQTVFPGSNLGDALKMVARLISVRKTFGAKRQVYFAGIGGFDTHGEDQMQRQQELLGEVSGAMTAFYNATNELGLSENVTAFTASDFNRNFPTNGRGSDHAWGSHHMVVGGAVRGNAMYGKFPALIVDGPDDANNGSWIPTTSVDQYAATLATWFGVPSTELNLVFPNLNKFATANLGFMA
jgi:uncharacterized protein (DUF1501 family)